MNATFSPSTVNAARQRRLLGFLVISALASVLAQMSTRDLAEAEAEKPAPVSVARMRLENRGGRLFRPGARAPFAGWVVDRFSTGEIKLRSAFVDGRLHGESEGWFTNGMREVREQFQRGLPHGTRLTWHPNGQKRSEGQLVAGLQQGLYRQWHENGKLAAEAEFESGKPHGLSRAWYPSGCLKAEALMSHGEIQTRHVYPDGDRREPTLLAGNRTP